MIVELLGALESHASRQLIPEILELPVHQHTVSWPLRRSASWSACGDKRLIGAAGHRSTLFRPTDLDEVLRQMGPEQHTPTQRVV